MEVIEPRTVGGRLVFKAQLRFHSSLAAVVLHLTRAHARRSSRDVGACRTRGVGGRSFLQGAGGSTSSPAVGFRCWAALTRASARFIVGLSYSRARLAGGRTFGSLARSNSQELPVRIHDGRQTISNYAFKRTAELALGSNQVFAPQPLNAALDPKRKFG